MRNWKFLSCIIIIGLMFTRCQKEEINKNSCIELVNSNCSHLCNNETMHFLSNNSSSGTCVMSIFLNDCPHEFLVDGELVDSEGWMMHVYNNPLLDSTVASSFLIHESMHSISDQVNELNMESFILVDCEQSWVVPITETFPTIDIVDGIPNENKTLRFNTYVESSNNIQVKGVYGLLEEFAAYYQGSKTMLEIGESLNQIDIPTKAKIYSNNSVIPYFEFKYWILTYLIYAETNHPNKFDLIMNNVEFLQSFKLLNDRYMDLVTQFKNYHDPSNDLSEVAFRNVLVSLESDKYLLMTESLE